MAKGALGWIIRLRDIEREHDAARAAVAHFLRSLHDGNVRLAPNLKRIHINRLSESLEGTYIIRIFSEFELSLKLFLKKKHEAVPLNVKARIRKVANIVGFKDASVNNAHKARRYRNKVVHHLEEEVDTLTLRKVTRFLCIYLGKMRKDW